MGIVVNLDVMMAKRKMSLGELAQKVDITMANLSGGALLHPGGHLQGPGLPAGGYSGVRA